MKLDRFRRAFLEVNAVMFGKDYALFRKPLQLVNLVTEETTRFKNLDEAFSYELDGKRLSEYIEAMERIGMPLEGGRGSGSGLNKNFKFGHASGGGGKDSSRADLPAKLNVRIPIQGKSPEAALEAFRKLHALSNTEYGVTVDEQGFITQYVHGNATSVGIWGNKGEMVYHNHPSGGAFSDSDLLSVSATVAKGIVASGKNGDYIFVKGGHFKAQQFMSAVKNATLSGKDYDDAVDKWLTKNQKKFGYSYVFKKAK